VKPIAVFAIACLAACTSKNPQRPPELGDCTPTPDAACPKPVAGGGVGGGGSGGNSDSGAPTTLDASISGTADTGICGTADSLINAANPAVCQSCIVMTCCLADQRCTGACASLLQCTQGPQGCSPKDQGCIARCETLWLDGLPAYQDLALCSSMSCSPQCPVLPQQ
jgi:hypothetical protein